MRTAQDQVNQEDSEQNAVILILSGFTMSPYMTIDHYYNHGLSQC